MTHNATVQNAIRKGIYCSMHDCKAFDIDVFFCESAQKPVNAHLQRFSRDSMKPTQPKLALSPRQAAIVTLAGQGLPDKLIADQLECAVGTIKSHWKLIRLRLGAANRAQCVFQFFNGLGVSLKED